MTLWISALPSWLAFAVVLVAANAAALGAMAVARRYYARAGVPSGPPPVGAWATAVGGLCAMLFAFTIVTLWNATTTVKANIDAESTAMVLLARDVEVAQRPLIAEYVRQTVEEWPRLCGGSENPSVESDLMTLERLAKPRKPEYANDLYLQLGTLENMRDRRWRAASHAVPDEVLAALGVLALTLFVVLAIAFPERLDTHLALTLAIGTAIGTLFWVAVLLEYPFCGSGTIGPQQILTVTGGHVF